MNETIKNQERGVEIANKVQTEITLMHQAAENGYWIEVFQAETGSASIREAKQFMNDENKEVIASLIERTRKLFEKAKKELGTDEKNIEDVESGSKKGISQELIVEIEEKLSDLEKAFE